ncbi:MAG: hypothetical protein PHY45_17695 [Rhodocyclaceae bacterium]|nr:hypothetical protein [Rhodocyclaceae bacterium]
MSSAILDFLKIHGDQLDSEIAESLHLSRAQVASEISRLSASGDLICCKVTRYVDGKKIEGVSCRLSGSLPKAAPGPKIGASRNEPLR